VTKVLEVLGRSTGGVGKHVAEVVNALDGNSGLTLNIAAPADLLAPMPKDIVSAPIPDGLRGHPRAVRALRRLLDEGAYDLVHAHGLRAGMDAGLACRWASVPVLVTLHNLIVPEVAGGLRASLYRHIEPLVIRLSSRTFVPSRGMAERLADRSPRLAPKVEVLYAGVAEVTAPVRSRTEVRAELGLEEDQRLVVTVARLHPQKALDVMVGAMALMGGPHVLAIVGNGPSESELRLLCEELGVSDRVRFLGWRADATDLVAAADVFCLSSVWEAVPLAAQEAVLLGTAVVATRVGGIDELIIDGDSGRLVPKSDAASLARALQDVLASDVERKRFADRARADYPVRFTRDHIVGRLLRTYSEYARG
jgi:glycosyltransferase involved in cell wall biosynthesis